MEERGIQKRKRSLFIFSSVFRFRQKGDRGLPQNKKSYLPEGQGVVISVMLPILVLYWISDNEAVNLLIRIKIAIFGGYWKREI